ncbi:hypothetical protein D9M68_790330 [compost metagenome]
MDGDLWCHHRLRHRALHRSGAPWKAGAGNLRVARCCWRPHARPNPFRSAQEKTAAVLRLGGLSLTGGVDGARTRDLRRDRAEPEPSIYAGFGGVFNSKDLLSRYRESRPSRRQFQENALFLGTGLGSLKNGQSPAEPISWVASSSTAFMHSSPPSRL